MCNVIEFGDCKRLCWSKNEFLRSIQNIICKTKDNGKTFAVYNPTYQDLVNADWEVI